ncbi:S10 family peptidase [Calidithermus chliarophilus]|uniref:S10 family peptidase n=1 Tax=Calidithermus chliarophilus TaxID=52023 RepID=UPI00041FADBD|nr:peptidase S10 [Calidithermus chliarophilus]
MPEETKPADAKPAPQDNLVISRHTVRIGGQEVSYTVTCGTIVLKEESEKEGSSEGEKPKASVFFIAYTRDDVPDRSRRPITFSFNGGPGSSSVWLHLGVLGPRRVLMDDAGNPTPPPYRLVDNEHSLLDVSDLVFIDPVGTGYSRMVPGEKTKEYHGYKRDVESVGEFIRLYTSRYGRWTSPKFLIGESYGTTRAAGLSGHLQERHGMYFNGVMLVSSILDFATARFAPGHDLPHVLFLPTYAATAWYHKKLPPDLQKKPLRAFLDEVEAFAGGEYLRALFKGSALPEAEREGVLEKLSRYTGLSREYLEQTNLRVGIYRFCKELLRPERKTVGRLDSRFTGYDRDAAGENSEYDPSYATIQGPYTATFNQYVREELGFESDLPYEVLTGLYQNWSYKEYENQYLNVAETLRKAMNLNPYLKVFVGSGYYDLATPYFATDYTFAHLGLEPHLQANLQTRYYEAGHMMYVHRPSLQQMKQDLAAFVAGAMPGATTSGPGARGKGKPRPKAKP